MPGAPAATPSRPGRAVTPPAAPAGVTPPRQTQAQRFEAARKARARKSRNVRLGVAGVVLVLVALVVLNSVSNRRDTNALRSRLTAGSCRFDTDNDPIDPAPNNHVAPRGYDVNPPAGGNHDPNPAAAGTYQAGNAPTDARVVHALEHGYIAVWHRPDLDEKDMAAVTDAVAPFQRDVIVVPRPSLDVKVAVTAWGERLLCGQVEPKPLADFVKTYRNKGPERVPHP
ncbi:MAG: DUF3105 domain-containing protein [Acidimicrobiales bacterium]